MRENIPWAIIMSLIAGLSTSLGSLLILFTRKTNKKFLSFSIGFSAGVMSLLSIADLLPQAVHSCITGLGRAGGLTVALFFLFAGMIIFALLEKTLPETSPMYKTDNHKMTVALRRVGLISAIGIILHNFPEGIATFIAGYSDIGRGVSLTIAIALHNIPEGITVSVPIYFGTGSRLKAFSYATFTGLSEPLGALITYLILAPFISELLLGIIFALVAGMMLCICFYELLPASVKYGHINYSLSGTLTGLILMSIIMKLL